MALLISRCYTPGDENEIVALYNQITGRARKVEQHLWEWIQTPEGQGKIWVITEQSTGKIVGHHGLIPIRARYFSERVLLGKTENTILAPQYSGTGIYFLHERQFAREAEKTFDLLYTTLATGVPVKLRRKLGYKVVGKHITYFKYLQATRLIEKLGNALPDKAFSKHLGGVIRVLGLFLLPFIWLCFSRKCSFSKGMRFLVVDDINSVSADLEKLWEANARQLGITVDRNIEYLNWRTFQNPYAKYLFVAGYQQSRLVGYFITKTTTLDSQEPIGTIVDIFADSLNPDIFSALLREAERRFRAQGIKFISFPTIRSSNWLNRMIVKNGYLSREMLLHLVPKSFRHTADEAPVLLAKPLRLDIQEAVVFDPCSWYFTHLFTEGID